jgi:hypothetical protein
MNGVLELPRDESPGRAIPLCGTLRRGLTKESEFSLSSLKEAEAGEVNQIDKDNPKSEDVRREAVVERIVVDDNPVNSPDSKKPDLPLAMTRQQVEVFELLRGLSTDLEKFHEWYQGALQALDSRSSDRIAQAAHSIRELCDKLPDRIADIPKFKSPVSPVKSIQRDFMQIKTSSYAEGWNEKPINTKLNKLLLRLEEIFKLFNEPKRTARFQLALTASDPQAEFMSRAHREARDETFEKIGLFFQNTTHHNHIVDEAEFRKQVELFEYLLINYLTPCTATQQNELIALMARPPSPEALARVGELIAHKGANYVFFFEKLDNPSWLRPLEERGHFAELPTPEPISDGRIAYRFHVPLITLAKLAASAPQEVSGILVKLKLPDNFRVGDQIMQCMSKIRDPACIMQLRPVIAQLAENSTRASWLWIQELLQSWMESGVVSEIFVILQAYLNSAVDKSFEQHRDVSGTWLANQIDEQCLDKLTPKHPFEVTKLIFQPLCKWVHQEREKYKTSEINDDGPISYFVEDFKSMPLEHRGIQARLAKRLFSAAEQIYLQGDLSAIDRLNKMLMSNPWQLFRRLRWQLYADFPFLTLGNARAEVLQRIPFLSEIDYSHGSHDFEFAQLLIAHAKLHGNSFLSPNEVEQFTNSVLKGPIDKQGKRLEGNYDFFHRKQLWPIASLLRGEQLDAYRVLVPDDSAIKIEKFKPMRSGGSFGGFVASIAPKQAQALESMVNDELWSFLNKWEPKAGYEQDSTGRLQNENAFELANKFAELVEKSPHRFDPTAKWWENISRWEILDKLLDRSADRFASKQNDGTTSAPPLTDCEWANLFGITQWVMAHDWPRHAASRFLRSALKADCVIPDCYFSEIPELLRRLIEQDDPQLSENRNSFGDWLTTAINSVRGDAVESLLNFASRQNKASKKIDPWIFELIRSRLELPNESPAIFALFGAHLRFLIHLFDQELKDVSNLLFSPDRPEHRAALFTAHFMYDHPWNPILQTFPNFISDALDTLKMMHAQANHDEAKENRIEVGSRFGTHITCYYWSGAFSTESEGEAALDRFFDIVTPTTRAALISQIASIWEQNLSEKPDDKVIGKVMRIWERRFAQIERKLKNGNASSEYDGELAESTDFLGCECFPFEWRFKHAKLSIEQLRKAPRAYRLLKAIADFSNSSDRLESMLELLTALLKRPSDELRWSIQFKDLAPVVSVGVASENPNARKLASECKDLLLKMGFSDFLNLEDGNGE